MSHQTGIKCNDKLRDVFGSCKKKQPRLIKVSIINEELALSGINNPVKDWKSDYDLLIRPLIENTTPCYIFYRLDDQAWLLITWVPEEASVRQKMLYASTKATLKYEFGNSYITEEIHATIRSELTLDGYFRNKAVQSVQAPLTTREEEINEIRQSEAPAHFQPLSISGLQCPLTEQTKQAIAELNRGVYDYLQFEIDLNQELIELSHACADITLDSVSLLVPSDHARYHLYNFKHVHDGGMRNSKIFVYSTPGYNCSIKERMVYSSCKTRFIETIKSLGLDIAKKIEIDDGKELTEDFVISELYPVTQIHRPAFEKPKGPPNRGAKRLTRPTYD